MSSGVCYSSFYVISCFFFFKQKTSYDLRISDWSSDVCSSDLVKAGQKVTVNTAIGYVGSSGRSTGPHLHYEIWFDGHPLNPLKIFKIANDIRAQIGRASCRESVCPYV